MTRRIALAILATCCLVLFVGGAVAYVSVRAALLEELDASIVRRASVVSEVVGGADAVPEGDRYVVRNALGQTVAGSGVLAPAAGPGELRAARFATLGDGGRVRTATVAFPDGRGGETLVVYSSSAQRYDRLINRLWLTFAFVALVAGLLTAGVALAAARSALRPLRAAAETVASIDDRSLDRRLDAAALPDELRPMGERLNQMLARLDDGLRQRKQFMADAAHELRTPVSALMTAIEVALRRPRDPEALTGVLRQCLADVRVLRRLVEALLEQFRADATASTPAQAVDVTALLDLCADAAEPAARAKGVEVKRNYPRDLVFATQPQRLRSIVSNLLDNAVAYNVPGGSVDLSCDLAADGAATVVVRDTGAGIPEDLLPRVFEPFVRGVESTAADGDQGHCGLGLFLVRSHAEALGGACVVSSTVGQGSVFRMTLPPAPAPGLAVQPALAQPASPLPAGAPAAAATAAAATALTTFSCLWSILSKVS